MLFTPTLRRLSLLLSPFFLLSSPRKVHAPQPPQTPAAAPITMEQEHHHQLVFENSYVRAFYVEIPPHDSTLYHRHDLPYVSLPPPADDAPAPPAGASGRPTPPGPRVGYMAGGFSHAVSNTSDVSLRNVAIELLRPQGAVRNRCAEVARGQPLELCDKPASPDPSLSSHYTLFETDEIAVEYRALPPNSTFPLRPNLDTLVGGLRGVTTNAPLGARANGSFFEPQSGLLWLPAGSTTLFKAAPGGVGYFITIEFKDANPRP
jgi:hypothetical protein